MTIQSANDILVRMKDLMGSEIPKLLLATPRFTGHTLVKWNTTESKTDFGFMSSIFEAKLTTVADEM